MTQPQKSPRPSPLSVRLNEAELRQLRLLAGRLPVSTYVKRVLFEERRPYRAHSNSKPSLDPAFVARVLAILGSSHLAPNIARLAEAAESGNLFADDLTVMRLHQACDDLRALHLLLLDAMGKQTSKPRTMPIRHLFNAEAAQ